MNKTGYIPHTFKGQLIIDFVVNEEYRTLTIKTMGNGSQAMSLGLDHTDVPIEFVMYVPFNEDTAAALALCNVAPVDISQADKTFHRKQADMIFRAVRSNQRGGYSPSEMMRDQMQRRDLEKLWKSKPNDLF